MKRVFMFLGRVIISMVYCFCAGLLMQLTGIDDGIGFLIGSIIIIAAALLKIQKELDGMPNFKNMIVVQRSSGFGENGSVPMNVDVDATAEVMRQERSNAGEEKGEPVGPHEDRWIKCLFWNRSGIELLLVGILCIMILFGLY